MLSIYSKISNNIFRLNKNPSTQTIFKLSLKYSTQVQKEISNDSNDASEEKSKDAQQKNESSQDSFEEMADFMNSNFIYKEFKQKSSMESNEILIKEDDLVAQSKRFARKAVSNKGKWYKKFAWENGYIKKDRNISIREYFEIKDNDEMIEKNIENEQNSIQSNFEIENNVNQNTIKRETPEEPEEKETYKTYTKEEFFKINQHASHKREVKKDNYNKTNQQFRKRMDTDKNFNQETKSSTMEGFKSNKNIKKIQAAKPTQLAKLEANQMAQIDQNKQLIEEEDETKLTEEERMKKEIDSLKPVHRPLVYNLAYFANDSEVLRKLIELGVSIRDWDEDRKIGEFILKLDFDKDIKPYIIFLHDIGIPPETHPRVIAKNPWLFKEDLRNLQLRINYLEHKKFTQESIVRIITKVPSWLSMSVTEIDSTLGWYQNEFKLTGDELRQMVTDKPKLVTLSQKAAKVRFGLKEILGYDDETIKKIIVVYPRLLTLQFQTIEANFVYLTQVAKLTPDDIVFYPPVLKVSLIMLKSRYAYLKYLDRVQFDPSKPNYVSLKQLVEPDDEVFCEKTAKTSLNEYKKFLKTV